MNISERTLGYLRAQYEQNLDEWFDDPDEQFTGWSRHEFQDWYMDMLAIGEEIGTPFWSVVNRKDDFAPSPSEITRVHNMMIEAGIPLPQP